jgi:hypothetical protein
MGKFHAVRYTLMGKIDTPVAVFDTLVKWYTKYEKCHCRLRKFSITSLPVSLLFLP